MVKKESKAVTCMKTKRGNREKKKEKKRETTSNFGPKYFSLNFTLTGCKAFSVLKFLCSLFFVHKHSSNELAYKIVCEIPTCSRNLVNIGALIMRHDLNLKERNFLKSLLMLPYYSGVEVGLLPRTQDLLHTT